MKAAVLPATGPVADVTNTSITAINSQDAASLRSALSAAAALPDEDGHVGIPANVRAERLTFAQKKIAISRLMVGDLGTSRAWATFNSTMDETTACGGPNRMQGSSTIDYRRNGTDLKAVLIQLSVKGEAVTRH